VLQFEDSPAAIDEKQLELAGNKAKEMLLQLSHEQREVIILRLFGNLSFNEIAKITNVSVNTALGRMRYGLINLRKLVTENGVEL
jgi:RNA polymerase sigma-70 factor (ECF subfamily)